MAGQYDNTNRGALFRNKKKEPGDNRPDYTGKLDVEGNEVFVSGWIKKSKAGDTYLSLAVQQQQDRPQTQRAAPQQETPPPKDDDIPF